MKRVFRELPVGVFIIALLVLCNYTKIIASETSPPGKIDVSIYYAGSPKSARTKDFIDFLNQHFTRVQAGNLATFNGTQAKGFDVTILDYDGDGFESPRPQLSRSFTQPVITMGVTGAFICDELGLKTGYL